MKLIVTIPNEILKDVDNVVKGKTKYLSRSHFITEACKKQLKENY